jgi:hypothetical protein
MLSTELQEKALAIVKATLEEDEGVDTILDGLTEDEAEDVREALELAGHLLDVHLGYAEACPDYAEA